MTIKGPPPDLIWRYWPIYKDAYWRFAQLDQAAPAARVTSLYRTVAENAAAGGAPRSQHLLGLAVDWVVPEAVKSEFMMLANLLGLRALDEGDHIHVQRYQAGLIPFSMYPLE